MMPLPSMSGSGGSATSGDVTTGSTVFAPAFGAFSVGGKGTKQAGATATATASEPGYAATAGFAGSEPNYWTWLAVAGAVASVVGLGLVLLKKRRKG